jgi:RNA polymerase sigma-32 factor
MARDLGVPVEEVRHMEGRMASSDVSFDGHPDEDDEGGTYAPVHYLEDRRFDPARELEEADSEADSHDRLGNALASLDERSRTIVQRRWLDEQKATLHELAAQFSISAERIRQLEQAAINRLRSAMFA